MSPEAQAKLDGLKIRVTNSVSCEVVNQRGRRGIVKMKDRFGKDRAFYDHQVVAAQKLWLKQWQTPILQGRKAGLACLHDMGLGTFTLIRTIHVCHKVSRVSLAGKTITSILMIAGVRMLLPDLADELSLVVCPLSVLKTWADTFSSWTLYNDKVSMASHQSQITSDVMKKAKVILTTYADATVPTHTQTHTL